MTPVPPPESIPPHRRLELAAPQLLTALKRLVYAIEQKYLGIGIIDEIREARTAIREATHGKRS